MTARAGLERTRNRVGFMQGRLSPVVDGRIQCFPWAHWRQEFELAAGLAFERMEWTLDDERLAENPLLTAAGRREIRALSEAHGVQIRTLTGDFLMQAPFFRAEGAERARRVADLRRVIGACSELGIGILVDPLVDNGRVRDERDEDDVVEAMLRLEPELRAARVRIAFESDFPAAELARMMARLPSEVFGVNYDTGNSAALGYDPDQELSAYGERVLNVHVKDRPKGGTTVPLGQGDVDFPRVFAGLRRAGYRDALILQTARAPEGRHGEVLAAYRDVVVGWVEEAA